MTEWESCFDCVYSSIVNNMQSCAWKSGLASSYSKCERYKRDWVKTLMPLIFIGGFLILIVRMIIMAIWGI